MENGTKCETLNAVFLLCKTLGIQIGDLFDVTKEDAQQTAAV